MPLSIIQVGSIRTFWVKKSHKKTNFSCHFCGPKCPPIVCILTVNFMKKTNLDREISTAVSILATKNVVTALDYMMSDRKKT